MKNEISVLYSEIRDKRISCFLRKFLDTIQEYIVKKQKYYRKKGDLESFDQANAESSKVDEIAINFSKPKSRHRRHISAVRTLCVSDLEAIIPTQEEEEEPPSITRVQTDNLRQEINSLNAYKSKTETSMKIFNTSPSMELGPTFGQKFNFLRDQNSPPKRGPSLKVRDTFLAGLREYVEDITAVDFKLESRKTRKVKGIILIYFLSY